MSTALIEEVDESSELEDANTPTLAARLGVAEDRLVETDDVPFEVWARSYNADDRICELVDGHLVEKAVGAEESGLALNLGTLFDFANEQLRRARMSDDPPYHLLAGDGAINAGRNGRVPDLSVISTTAWLAAGKRPKVAPPPILAVEVLSESNTRREMRLKRADYFGVGVEEVWMADPEGLTVEVWTDVKKPVVYGADDAVPCGRLFPGLVVPVTDWLTGRLTRRSTELLSAIEPVSDEVP